MRLFHTTAAMVAIGTLTCAAQAQIAPVPNGSGAWGYFGARGTAYQDSDPTAIFTPPPNGPNPPGSPLLNVPTPPATMQYPFLPVPVGNIFTNPGGYQFMFTDPLNMGTTAYVAAQTQIDHIFNPVGTLTSDASIDFPIWRFSQGPTALSYAYEQINFVSQYQVSTGLAASAPSIPLFVSGGVSAGGTPYVQFDAAITYWWVDTNTAWVATGTPVNLGTLYYSWVSGATTFNQTIFSTGSLAATGPGPGILELSGYAYVMGDPFEIEITSVPEPATLAWLVAGGLTLVSSRRRASR